MGHLSAPQSARMPDACEVHGSLEDLNGERYYKVANYDAMPPFLMSLVSDSDHWLFISSHGALTAGRRDPDHALFPYYTDDLIHDSAEVTGSKTLFRVRFEGRSTLWEPFSERGEGRHRITRNLYKSVFGNKILFEEINHDLALTFRYEWMNSERFGFVRRATLVNHGVCVARIELLDGLQNVLPFGLDRRFQMEYSTLADGYKRTERVAGTPLALYRLSSIPVDKAEPSEALRVNAVWSLGLEPAQRLLSSSQVRTFRKGGGLRDEVDIRGQRGAYFLNASLDLAPGESREWFLVAELGLDSADVQALKARLEKQADVPSELLEDIGKGTQNLVRIVASADGLQVSEDELSNWRHFSNTLFNVMRGGLPDDGYRVSRADLQSFLAKANTEVALRHEGFLAQLPEVIPHSELKSRAVATADPDMERLVHEYLPLTFSRRHGDPSRPWNIFSIQVKDEQGRKLLNYQGNWRDLFQNWEALGVSYPGFLESMIFKFADSSTADGYNPYRVTREGFEWEVIDPHDAWSFIGYWGDHQVIYFLKLLEASHRYHPGLLVPLLDRRVFTFANVPYRIKPYPEMLADPRRTITFDAEAHARIMALAQTLGADGKALMGEGGPVRANLAEKLLVVILTKLSSFVPEAGIWMNTQRPEWNDANNALVGYGVSVVTLAYLRRFIAFCEALLRDAESGELEFAREIADLLEHTAEVFAQVPQGQPMTDRERKRMLDALGEAGSRYRANLQEGGFSGDRVKINSDRLMAFFGTTLRHIDHALRANRRKDGLYHAYNLMKVAGDALEVRRLYPMLEGQVAMLSSGLLTPAEAAELLDALRASSLYREDQASYMLYPDRELPSFLEMNNLPAEVVAQSKLIQSLLEEGNGRILRQDLLGGVHFHPDFRNADELKIALKGRAEHEVRELLDLYERMFDHQSFTGRSGSFYKYEGLGCIYWHMVSKLLLAVDEVRQQALGGDPAILERLKAHYREIREGIGVHKSPALYGAIPTDPYSHTPGFAGAQQPGMTGQVKEDILSRASELGVRIREGRIGFHAGLLDEEEFLSKPRTFSFIDLEGASRHIHLPEGSLAFTLCQVPVVVHRSALPSIKVARRNGTESSIAELELDERTSAAIFQRQDTIKRVDVFLGLGG